eukprot:2113395-Rhodomonas_salina.1
MGCAASSGAEYAAVEITTGSNRGFNSTAKRKKAVSIRSTRAKLDSGKTPDTFVTLVSSYFLHGSDGVACCGAKLMVWLCSAQLDRLQRVYQPGSTALLELNHLGQKRIKTEVGLHFIRHLYAVLDNNGALLCRSYSDGTRRANKHHGG